MGGSGYVIVQGIAVCRHIGSGCAGTKGGVCPSVDVPGPHLR